MGWAEKEGRQGPPERWAATGEGGNQGEKKGPGRKLGFSNNFILI